MGYSPWCHKELDMTEHTHHTLPLLRTQYLCDISKLASFGNLWRELPLDAALAFSGWVLKTMESLSQDILWTGIDLGK